MFQHLCLACVIFTITLTNGQLTDEDEISIEDGKYIHVQKCCPEDEMMVQVGNPFGPKVECQPQNQSFEWAPEFVDNDNNVRPFNVTKLNNTIYGKDTVLCAGESGPCIIPSIGKPECGPVRAWSIYTYAGFQEELQLRSYGILRHVIGKHGSIPHHYEYSQEQYCVDGVQQLVGNTHNKYGHHSDPTVPKANSGPTYYAIICVPGPVDDSASFLSFVAIFYPVGLGVGLFVLLLLVSIHIFLKELRDLSGCMLISLNISLIVSMAGNLILSATDSKPSPYINLFVLESIVHSSDVAVHFWLNSIGHRAWTAIRYPRKEAIRPEGKRYFFYSIYVWGSSSCILALALMVHFFIDTNNSISRFSPHSFFTWYNIGWLGLALFCSTCAFLLMINIYFYVTTRANIAKQTAYGRTFHRNKGFFRAFTRFFIIIDTIWMIQTLSWLQYPILVGLRIIADITLPFLILWATLKGRRVMHLIKIRLQMSQCWLCRRCFASRDPNLSSYYGEEMIAFGTPI